MNTLEEWTKDVVAELGLAKAVDRDLVLDPGPRKGRVCSRQDQCAGLRGTCGVMS